MLTIRLNRVLSATSADASVPGVVANWRRPDDTPVPASYVTASFDPE